MTPRLDPRNLARVRTQVWFAEMALKALAAEAAFVPEPEGEGPASMAADQRLALEEAAEALLGPIIHLLEASEARLSEAIDSLPGGRR